jgi:hypothetical protein
MFFCGVFKMFRNDMTCPEGENEKTKPPVSVYTISRGELTEVKILEEVFCVRSPCPDGLDPVLIAQNFLKVFDLEKTKLMRKMKAAPLGSGRACAPAVKTRGGSWSRTTKITETEEPVGIEKNIKVYKNKIISFYRLHSDSFTSKEMNEFFEKVYPEISKATAMNKQNAYIRFLRNQGLIESIKSHSKGNCGVFRFVSAPYGAEKAAQAEFDQGYAKIQMASDLEAMRRTA